MTPRFTISILAYGGVDYTRNCLKSVLDHSKGQDWEMILTDNASSDGMIDLFRSVQDAFPDRVRIVRNRTNKGFIEPNRHALEMAKGEYFIMLNNDSEVPEGWLEKLERPFDKWDTCGLVGSQGGCTELDEQMRGRPGIGLEYLEGSCLMGRTEFLKRIGLFSPELEFAYSEDSDLSLRVREMGLSIHQADFQLRHIRAQTSQRVGGIERFKEANYAYMRTRWAHYAKARRMDYPIIVKRRGATGDVLLTTPIIRALHEQRPLCPIHVETDCTAIFRGNPYIASCSKSQRPHRDALVIDLNMAYENRPNRHYLDGYIEAAGIGGVTFKTDLYLNEFERRFASRFLGLGRFCAVHPGVTGWPGRDWPYNRWQEVLDGLARMGWRTVLVGANQGPLVCDIDLRGKTTIHQLAATLKTCCLFVGIDSFPLHVAQAMGTPVVPLFGCSLPQYVLTHGSRAYPIVGQSECTGQRHKEIGRTFVSCDASCIKAIQVSEVMATIEAASATITPREGIAA